MSVSLLSLAGNGFAQTVEEGYPLGSLAVAAIERQDWGTAERLLTQSEHLQSEDPARLINLGRVYLATGRREEAVRVFRRAVDAKDHVEVVTREGTVASTRDLARAALVRNERLVRSASR